jgi:hypothetical protein
MSFLANPIANISGGIHDLGKSSLGRMAEAAALMYFTGDPEGFLATDGVSLAGQMGVTSTAGLAGLAGGATSLLNGGSLMDAVKSGGMMYLGTQGIEALGGSVPTGNTPDINFDTPARALSGAENVSLVPKNVSQFTVPTSITDTELGQAGLDRAYTTTPLQAPVAPVDQFAAQNNSLINGTYGQAPALSGVNTGYGFDNNSTGYIGENSYREGLAAGKGALGSSSSGPSTGFFSGLKDKFMALPGYQQAGIGAAGLLALKGMAKNNTVTKPTDNRKIKYYGGNPYSGAGFMRETPVLAASGGIVALANGGTTHYDDGGPVFVSDPNVEGGGLFLNPSQLATYAGGRYANAAAPAPAPAAPAATPAPTPAFDPSSIGSNASTAQIATAISALQTKGLTDNQIAQQLYNQGIIAPQVLSAVGAKPGDANYNRVENAYGQATLTNPSVYGINPNAPVSAGLAALDTSITGSATATPAQAGQVALDRTYLNSIMNPTADAITNVAGSTAADKAEVIRKAINAANNVYGGNNTASQKVIAQLMDVWKINPDTVQSALGSSYTGPSVQSLYNAVDPALAAGVTPAYVNQGSFYTAPVDKTVTTNTNTNTVTVDPNTLASSLGLPKGTYKTVNDVYSTYATSLGLPPGNYTSMADIKSAIMAMSVTPKTPTTPPPVNLAPVVNLAPTTTTTPSLDKNGYYVPATAPTTTNNGQTYNAGYISNTANPTTAQGVGGSHAFVNPNGYISQAPAMPFRPIGGYGTLQAAKDAFTKAGGSLGYTSPKAQAVTTEEATQHYLDMLSGKKPMSKVPYTPTGEIAKPYYTSVMGMPENPRYTVSQPKIYDAASRRYVDNPNYDPAFSATADYVGDAQTGLSQKTKDFFAASGTKDPSVDTKTISKALANSVPEDTPSFGSNAPADFDSEAYLKAHPDVAAELANGKANFGSAYGHYLMYGANGSKIKDPAYAYTKKAAGGGLMALAAGGMPGIGTLGGYSDGGRLLRGPGDGISDSIPATIGARNPQPARLADGEFVVPARIVSELGNGSTEAGARKLYQMMDRVQNARKKTTGKQQVAANPRAEQYLPA